MKKATPDSKGVAVASDADLAAVIPLESFRLERLERAARRLAVDLGDPATEEWGPELEEWFQRDHEAAGALAELAGDPAPLRALVGPPWEDEWGRSPLWRHLCICAALRLEPRPWLVA